MSVLDRRFPPQLAFYMKVVKRNCVDCGCFDPDLYEAALHAAEMDQIPYSYRCNRCYAALEDK